MSDAFFERPILNSPYEYPSRHWMLNEDGQPSDVVLDSRRRSKLITPVPQSKKRSSKRAAQSEMSLGSGDDDQAYDPEPIINEIRDHVDEWRKLPSSDQWGVTPPTARLLRHWRHHAFQDIRPFFCQVEAIETAIWLAEVAHKGSTLGKKIWQYLAEANQASNPDLFRIALKLATGAGKTTVMAMLIAWQAVNAARQPGSSRWSRGFLIVTPGITIRDRLRVLQPNDPESYYRERELVPPDMLGDIDRTKIVITNYHAFIRRETMEVSKAGRALLKGRGPELQTLETEGQMLHRVMPELTGLKNIVVINDEAHHCYREKPDGDDEDTLKGEDKNQAKKDSEKARVWISGLEIAKRKLGVSAVYDLSATPFFLRGSGYREGTLFPWVVSDFSLMDAIECGIVKLPRIPVADNLTKGDMPAFRDLWKRIGKKMPKKGRGKSGGQHDPLSLPAELQAALQALYGHYKETFDLWQDAEIEVPPVFIVVCNNTSTSKLIHDYIAGFHQEHDDGTVSFVPGRLDLFRNFNDYGNPEQRPRTLLIDSVQLESGDKLDDEFRKAAADEIERFRRERVARSGNQRDGDSISPEDLLREVMNTVGKPGKLGADIRCVVSVSMLTEGWDANTVTHILGVRAFGTELLCEQVVGRALRRQSYRLNDEGLLNPEYADILGIPFDFTAKPVLSKPQRPIKTVRVHAVSPERDRLEIRFPRVEGYRTELPADRLRASFSDASRLTLRPELVGPSITRNQGIVGEGVDLTIDGLEAMRQSSIVYHLTKHLIYRKYRDPGDQPKMHLFGQLKRIVRQWMDGGYLVCEARTYPAQLIYLEIADMAAERIQAAITESFADECPIKAILDSYNPAGSTNYVNFTTSKENRWDTSGPPSKCHLNWIMLDSDWEAEFCRVAEAHPRVLAYVKNHALGFEVPYRYGGEARRYVPDFILRIDDGRGPDDPLHLVVEISGYPKGDKQDKATTMRTYWVPGVNNLKRFGRWAFEEFSDVYEMEAAFGKLIESSIQRCSA